MAAAAHHAGTKSAQERADEEAQSQRIAELEAQQRQAQYAAAPSSAPGASPAGTGVTNDVVAELTNLKQLLDSGVLSQAEFDAQKQRILEGL